jgi:methyl-accepting chemotaxis protein
LRQTVYQILQQNLTSLNCRQSETSYVSYLIYLGLFCLLMFGSVVFLTRPLRRHLVCISNRIQTLAHGDLTQNVTVRSSDEIGEMSMAINDAIRHLGAVMHDIAQYSGHLTTSGEKMAAISHNVSDDASDTSMQLDSASSSAEQISKNVQTVATATEEMNASIKEIARSVSQAMQVSVGAVQKAQVTNTIVSKLAESSLQIRKIVKVITSVAEQTNLLSLNATIEAARAGESGKGFAVVANQVKELSKETAKATEDIGQKIETIQLDTKNAVEAISQITAVINQISEIYSTIAAAVEEQMATTNEITRNMSEVAAGSKQIAYNIAVIAKAAQNSNNVAKETKEVAEKVKDLASGLQKVIGQFKYEKTDKA